MKTTLYGSSIRSINLDIDDAITCVNRFIANNAEIVVMFRRRRLSLFAVETATELAFDREDNDVSVDLNLLRGELRHICQMRQGQTNGNRNVVIQGDEPVDLTRYSIRLDSDPPPETETIDAFFRTVIPMDPRNNPALLKKLDRSWEPPALRPAPVITVTQHASASAAA